MRKYVVSTSLDKAEWNNSQVIKGNVIDEIAKLKKEPGQDIVIHGSCTLVQSLMPHDLIDQFNLLVYPIVLGKGKRLFAEGPRKDLKLAETKAIASGVVLLSHQPAST